MNKKIIVIAASVICMIVVFVIVLNKIIIPNCKYNDAVALMNDGKYEEAIVVFKKLDAYKDSSDKITECEYEAATDLMEKGAYTKARIAFEKIRTYKDSKEKAIECYTALRDSRLKRNKEILKTCKVGDYIKFGEYEQDNSNLNGKEEIEWRVLSRTDNEVAVVSKYALDRPDFASDNDSLWFTTITGWLLNDFCDVAFSNEEKAMINSVSLLSSSDVYRYFEGKAGKCIATDYAKARGVTTPKGMRVCSWWLIGGSGFKRAEYVDWRGIVIGEGEDFTRYNGIAIRPTMRITVG